MWAKLPADRPESLTEGYRNCLFVVIAFKVYATMGQMEGGGGGHVTGTVGARNS